MYLFLLKMQKKPFSSRASLGPVGGAHVTPTPSSWSRFAARREGRGQWKRGWKKERREKSKEERGRSNGGLAPSLLEDRRPWLLISNCFDYSEIQPESCLVWMIWWMWTGKTAVYDDQSEESRRWSDTGRANCRSCQQCLFSFMCDSRHQCCLHCHIVHSRADCYSHY